MRDFSKVFERAIEVIVFVLKCFQVLCQVLPILSNFGPKWILEVRVMIGLFAFSYVAFVS